MLWITAIITKYGEHSCVRLHENSFDMPHTEKPDPEFSIKRKLFVLIIITIISCSLYSLLCSSCCSCMWIVAEMIAVYTPKCAKNMKNWHDKSCKHTRWYHTYTNTYSGTRRKRAEHSQLVRCLFIKFISIFIIIFFSCPMFVFAFVLYASHSIL